MVKGSTSNFLQSLIRIDGNRFDVEDDTAPWHFPLDNVQTDKNIRRPPEAKSNAIENYPLSRVVMPKNILRPLEISAVAVGGVLVATLALLFVVQINRSLAQEPRSLNGDNDSQHTLPASFHTVRGKSNRIVNSTRKCFNDTI